MKVIIAKDYDEMSKKAFEVMAAVVKENPEAVLGLATGSTPIGLYKNMIEDHEKNGTSYKKIRTANLDEYAGLDYSSDQSYVYFMRHNLFDHIDIDLKNTNIENGKAADRQAECDRYNALLEKMPRDIRCSESVPTGISLSMSPERPSGASHISLISPKARLRIIPECSKVSTRYLARPLRWA